MVRRHVEFQMKDLEKSGRLRERAYPSSQRPETLPLWVRRRDLLRQVPPCPVGCLKRLIPLREDLFKDVIRGGLSRFAFMRFLPTTRARSLQTLISSVNPSIKSVYHHSRLSNPLAPIVLINEAVNQGSISL